MVGRLVAWMAGGQGKAKKDRDRLVFFAEELQETFLVMFSSNENASLGKRVSGALR